MRKHKRVVRIGNVKIGGKHPIAVQSMTKTRTADIKGTVRQIRRLQKAGCELIRCAVVNKEDALALRKIKASVSIPVIADIHFDYRLALTAIESGVDKIRINPGNIGEPWKIEEIIKRAKEKEIPIRIGVNSGSSTPISPIKRATSASNATGSSSISSSCSLSRTRRV